MRVSVDLVLCGEKMVPISKVPGGYNSAFRSILRINDCDSPELYTSDLIALSEVHEELSRIDLVARV